MALVWSATKGLSAMALALAHSRGWLDYDERVATYWPEFAQNGKQEITVRQLLAQQALDAIGCAWYGADDEQVAAPRDGERQQEVCRQCVPRQEAFARWRGARSPHNRRHGTLLEPRRAHRAAFQGSCALRVPAVSRSQTLVYRRPDVGPWAVHSWRTAMSIQCGVTSNAMDDYLTAAAPSTDRLRLSARSMCLRTP
jgi:hypothetical protein